VLESRLSRAPQLRRRIRWTDRTLQPLDRADPLWLLGARLRTAVELAPLVAGVPFAVAALPYAAGPHRGG
jgi:hypothetical protein